MKVLGVRSAKMCFLKAHVQAMGRKRSCPMIEGSRSQKLPNWASVPKAP